MTWGIEKSDAGKAMSYEVTAKADEQAIFRALCEVVGERGTVLLCHDREADFRILLRDAPEIPETENRFTKRRLADAYQEAARNGYVIPGTEEEGPGNEGYRAVAIDCGIVWFACKRYSKQPHQKVDAKYHLMYVLEVDDREISSHETITQAKEAAKILMDDPSFEAETVTVRRKPVSDGGNDVAALYEAKTRTAKTRPTHVPRGTKIEAMHRWLVYGRWPTG